MSNRALPEAEREALRAAASYDRQSPGKSTGFVDNLDEPAEIIQRQPRPSALVTAPPPRGEFRVYFIMRFECSSVDQIE